MRTNLPADFAEKVHRGIKARVRLGHFWGSVPYGYRTLPKQVGGLTVEDLRQSINPAEAAVVIRIFELFESGKSPRTIARELNAQGIPGKDGRIWTESMVRGHAQRGSGILRNQIYVGRQIWNRQRFARHPDTGREVGHVNPEDEWVVTDVPELRIVPKHLWEKAQARLRAMRDIPAARRGRMNGVGVKGPPKHLFDGLAKCATCGGDLAPRTANYLSCSAARKAACSDRTDISRLVFEEAVLQAIKIRVATSGLTNELVQSFRVSAKRQRRHVALQKRAIEQELRTIRWELANLIKFIDMGLREHGREQRAAELARRHKQLEARLDELLRASTSESQPNVAEVYRKTVRSLRAVFKRQATSQDMFEILRSVIDAMVVRQREGVLEVELIGDVADVLGVLDAAAQLEAPPRPRSVKILTGAWLLSPPKTCE
jgi:site-specific DNA recombinase